MSWKEKRQQTPFEQTEYPIHGLFFLDGDVLARVYPTAHTEGLKYPMIVFPSGEEFPLWEVGKSDQGIVHLFGEMDLALRSTRDDAAARAQDIANMCGYAVRSRGENQLDVWGSEPDERFTITYDNAERTMIDISVLTEAVEAPIHPAHVLMNDEIKAKLPPLRSTEKQGLDALAVIKYFTPDAGWTWYATEFDGYDIFFGLVIGYEDELGIFSLSELASIRGRLGLPIERDLHFEPTPLGELLERHRRERGGM